MMRKIYTLLLIASCSLTLGCDRSQKAAPTPAEVDIGDSPEDPRHDVAGDDHHGVHLGEQMYELSRRFAAVWFAGQAGNKAMVEYQLHEMHEVIEELEEQRPIEAGVDVAARLERDVEAQFKPLEAAVVAGEKEEFRRIYTTVVANCNACHVETKHPFIVVSMPVYNPYPNLQF